MIPGHTHVLRSCSVSPWFTLSPSRLPVIAPHKLSARSRYLLTDRELGPDWQMVGDAKRLIYRDLK